MVREDNQAEGYSCEWVYDEAGNILARIAYDYTTGDLGEIQSYIEYAYDDSEWGDLLTSFDGMEVWYDDIGNVLVDGVREYTWQNGRELASITMMGEDIPWNFTYDADGMRVRRAYGNTVYRYVYNGSQLGQMTVLDHTLRFTYDADGSPVSVTFDGTTYYYVTNLQGDVIAIVDGEGMAVVEYIYDAWGNILSTTDTSGENLGYYNPLRYRGYVYDTETGLYYLQSRYYNPEWGRFINADGQISGVGENLLGYNMFAYCFNNPVNLSDPDGNWPSWSTILKATAIAVTAVAIVAAVVVTIPTFGAASIAATIVASSAITIAAKATEVAVLQGKKSASEGKDAGQVATDIIESVFDNGVNVVAKTAALKTIGYASGFYSQSSSFRDVIELQKMDGYNLKVLAGAATYEITNRFTDLKYCVSTTATKGSMRLSYGFAALNVASTVISIFADDPEQRAMSRGYTLK